MTFGQAAQTEWQRLCQQRFYPNNQNKGFAVTYIFRPFMFGEFFYTNLPLEGCFSAERFSGAKYRPNYVSSAKYSCGVRSIYILSKDPRFIFDKKLMELTCRKRRAEEIALPLVTAQRV